MPSSESSPDSPMSRWQLSKKSDKPVVNEDVLGFFLNGEVHVVYYAGNGRWARRMDKELWSAPERWMLLPPDQTKQELPCCGSTVGVHFVGCSSSDANRIHSADSRHESCTCLPGEVYISQGCPVHDPSAVGEGQCEHDLVTAGDTTHVKWGDYKVCLKCHAVVKPDGSVFMESAEQGQKEKL